MMDTMLDDAMLHEDMGAYDNSPGDGAAAEEYHVFDHMRLKQAQTRQVVGKIHHVPDKLRHKKPLRPQLRVQ